jgi:ubiquinone/menaquinone biosynthesis C-methylase UbiE
MSESPETQPTQPTSTEESYSHQDASAAADTFAQRAGATYAAFFLPHLRPGMDLLDCGCGPGSITLDLAAAVAPGSVVGIDLQRSQVERARALAAERGVPTVRFEEGSVYDLPFPAGSFDAVYAHTLLMHLSEPVRALREMRRVLRPGGCIGIRDPDLGLEVWAPELPLLAESQALRRRVLQHNGGGPFYARHQRRLLLEAGFARVEASASLQCYGTAEETRRSASVAAATFAALARTAIEQGWVDQAAVDAMLTEIVAWGERPDAFRAIGLCHAVGWVDA